MNDSHHILSKLVQAFLHKFSGTIILVNGTRSPFKEMLTIGGEHIGLDDQIRATHVKHIASIELDIPENFFKRKQKALCSSNNDA